MKKRLIHTSIFMEIQIFYFEYRNKHLYLWISGVFGLECIHKN